MQIDKFPNRFGSGARCDAAVLAAKATRRGRTGERRKRSGERRQNVSASNGNDRVQNAEHEFFSRIAERRRRCQREAAQFIRNEFLFNLVSLAATKTSIGSGREGERRKCRVSRFPLPPAIAPPDCGPATCCRITMHSSIPAIVSRRVRRAHANRARPGGCSSCTRRCFSLLRPRSALRNLIMSRSSRAERDERAARTKETEKHENWK